jgi:hypothetical protein
MAGTNTLYIRSSVNPKRVLFVQGAAGGVYLYAVNAVAQTGNSFFLSFPKAFPFKVS